MLEILPKIKEIIDQVKKLGLTALVQIAGMGLASQAGAGGSAIAGRYFWDAWVKNIRVMNYLPPKFRGIDAHGAMHSNLNVWNRYIFPALLNRGNEECP